MKKWLSSFGLVILMTAIVTHQVISLARAVSVEPGVPIIPDEPFVDRAAPSVVMLTDLKRSHGGTGFQVKAPSGLQYTMTNLHICELANAQGQLQATDEFGKTHIIKKIKESETHDLCLMEGISGLPALSMADSLREGTYAMVIGHPYLQPLHISAGVMLGLVSISMADELKPDNKCNRYGEHIETIPALFGLIKLKVCVRTLLSYGTNILIYPGNSGSPVVDLSGRVIGVAYAGNGMNHWGAVVPLWEVQKLLLSY